MYTAVFDAGGHESDQPCLAVAGFICQAARWTEFSTEWKKALDEFGLSEFHMTQHKHKPEILARFLGLLPGVPDHKFGCGVDFATFNAMPTDIRAHDRLNAYALCARVCVAGVQEWALHNQIGLDRIRYVFEDGDIGKGLFLRIMERDGEPTPVFDYKKETRDKKGVIRSAGFLPLQAADMVAHAFFEQIRNGGPDRLPYDEIERVHGKLGVLTQRDMDRFVGDVRYFQSQGIDPFA